MTDLLLASRPFSFFGSSCGCSSGSCDCRSVGGGSWSGVNVVDEGGAWVVEVASPGVGPDAVEATVEGDALVLRARVEGDRERTYRVRGFRPVGWERAFRFGGGAALGDVSVTVRDGVVVARVPRVEAEPKRRVEVKAA